jgi:hypothetical protein
MKPSQVSDALRRVAAAIEASSKPNPRLVLDDLSKIVRRIAASKLDLQQQLMHSDTLYDFMDSLIGNVEEFYLGDPLDNDPTSVYQQNFKKVVDVLKKATSEIRELELGAMKSVEGKDYVAEYAANREE